MSSDLNILMTLANLASPPAFGLLAWENYLFVGIICVVVLLTQCPIFKPWYSPILAGVPLAFIAGFILVISPWGTASILPLLELPIYICLVFAFGMMNFKHPQPLNRMAGYLYISLGGLGLLLIFTGCLASCLGPVIAVCVGLAITAGAPIAFVQYRRNEVKKAFRQTYHCTSCDYDLRGTLNAEHCPECGSPVSLDPEKLKLVFPEDD